jgi:hypothetical protein
MPDALSKFLGFIGSAYFETQVYAVCLLGLMWVCALLLEKKQDRLNRNYLPKSERVLHYIPGVALLGLLPLGAALLSLLLILINTESRSLKAHMLVLPIIGYGAGLLAFYLLTKLAFWIARRLRFRGAMISGILLVAICVLVLIVFIPVVLPAKLLFVIFAWVVVFYTGLSLLTPTWRVMTSSVVIIYIILANSYEMEKYRFPGLTALYDKVDRPTFGEYSKLIASGVEHAATLVDPVASLNQWYHRITGVPHCEANATGVSHPKFVIVASSGGAYRATFWTAAVLDILSVDEAAGRLPGFRESVRLLAGASGGMIASAYFAADDPSDHPWPTSEVQANSLSERITHDIKTSLDDRGFNLSHPLGWITRNPMASDRDSLSAIARQLVLFDMPRLLWPFRLKYDRGQELENQWKTLSRTFASLRDEEARGLRPSLIFSPMLVDTGVPLIISNLDLGSVYPNPTEAVELFKWLPGSQDLLKVQTAARMSATFPFISPSVRLPTIPPYRVVDAGYYDSFGISVATSFLHEPNIMKWLKTCTSGVVLVQIRAWSEDAKPEQTTYGPLDKANDSFSWLTTPFEGLAHARSTTNFLRNRVELCLLRDLYRNPQAGMRRPSRECQDEEDFLQTVEFFPEMVDEEASFTWDLQDHEKEQIGSLINGEQIARARQRLAYFWRTPINYHESK